MTFKFYVEKIIQTEIKNIISNKGYVLETAFCSMLCEKYGFSKLTVIGTLRRIYAEIPLTKRRMSNELKSFYGLEVKGFPIVYLPVNDTVSHNGNELTYYKYNTPKWQKVEVEQ